MQVYPNRLPNQLQQKLDSCYLIFGDEPQQKLECLEQVRQAAKTQGFDERHNLVADSQFTWSSLLEISMSMSLFAARQLIELELPTGKPGTEGAKTLTALAQQANPDVLLVLHGPKVGKDVQNSKWFKTLDKSGSYIPCYDLQGNQLQQWLRQKMQAAGFTPTPQQLHLLSAFCEGNLLAAKQEIDKLALLYPDGQLSLEQMQAAMVEQSRFNVFQLVDVLLAGDAPRAVKILLRLESEGLEPSIVLWALVREWQTLNQLLAQQATGQPINWQQLRIWKNRQSLYQSAMQRLTLADLHALQGKLAHFDQQLKSTTVPRPYVELCHLCLMFMPIALHQIPLSA